MNIGDVRTIIEGDEIHFVAIDCCRALDIANVGNAMARLDADEKGIRTMDTLGGKLYTSIRWERVGSYLADFSFPQEVGENAYIPEHVFYRLAMKAKNAAAEKFQDWIAREVIPSIRKRGAYMTPATTGRRATKKPRLQRSFLAICFKSRLPFCPARCIISVPTNIKAARRTVFMSV